VEKDARIGIERAALHDGLELKTRRAD